MKTSKAWIINPTVSGMKREVECLLKIGILAKGRIITADQVRREVNLGRNSALAPCDTERFPALREGETITDYICRRVLSIYERERTHWGSHSATAHHLGMHRNTLYDWLEWARKQVIK